MNNRSRHAHRLFTFEHFVVGMALLAGVPGAATAGDAQDVALTEGSAVHFTTLDEARRLLSQADDFSHEMSATARSARMHGRESATEEQFLAYASEQAKPWSEDQTARLREVLEGLRARIDGLHLDLPAVIPLVQTTGQEEAGSVYVRGCTIVIPGDVLSIPRETLEGFLARALFHVYLKHHPERLARLYAAIGFQPCEPIVLPEPLRSMRIILPDAVRLCAYRQVEIEGRPTPVTPILLGQARNHAAMDAESAAPMRCKLLVLESSQDGWSVQIDASGQPVLHDPQDVPDYQALIRQHAGYMIHPDMVLAECFDLLIRHGENVSAASKDAAELRRVLLDEAARASAPQ